MVNEIKGAKIRFLLTITNLLMKENLKSSLIRKILIFLIVLFFILLEICT